NAFDQVAPKLFQISRTGKATGHADNRDIKFVILLTKWLRVWHTRSGGAQVETPRVGARGFAFERNVWSALSRQPQLDSLHRAPALAWQIRGRALLAPATGASFE